MCEMGVGVGTSTISHSRGAFNPNSGDQQNPLQPGEFISKPANSQAALTNPTGAVSSFEANIEGTYEIQLRVYDSFESSAPDTIRITAESDNGETGEGGDGSL